MSNRILTEAQLMQMAEKREQGWSYARIAKWFERQGVHIAANTIAWQCMRLGVLSPKGMIKASHFHGRGRPFTPDEDRQLIDMSMQGVSRNEMCRVLGRQRSSVVARLYILARNDALDEAA